MKQYFNETVANTLISIEGNKSGLSAAIVQERLERDGKNELDSEEKESVIKIFLKQFTDLLVIVLIVASVISMSIGEVESALVILVVITMNAILGTVQTIKAAKSLDSLKKLSTPFTRVKRDGTIQEVPSDELVVGDIIYLEAGDVVSADARVIESFNLQVNEASLTGEVESVLKHIDMIEDDKCALGDQKNMVFASGLVTYGRGVAIVVGIGMQTEIGKIATLMNKTKDKRTPLQQNLDDFSKKLSFVIIAICFVVFGLSMLRGELLIDAFMFSVALAVAAIPEALASIVTIVLSISTQKMVKENAIMKNINAVETLGCVSIICSDKTGTLTQNKMSVEDIYMNNTLTNVRSINAQDKQYFTLSLMGALCSDAIISNDQRIGDPTELAFMDMIRIFNSSEQKVRESYPRLDEMPFDSVRKLMSTKHSINNENVMYTKGAPDELLRICDRIYIDGTVRTITEEDVKAVHKQNEAFASLGQRVLGFAYKPLSNDIAFNESSMIFVALVSLIDPPREESKDAVAKCHIAGIKPIMITGDHKITAKAIAERIGIYKEGDICLEGRELEAMSEEELVSKLSQISVYARVAPEHKIRIVNAWQELGNNVAMTGDGVNDAPALKKADIGIAMGITGTEVSKDAASMILTDDNFSTIVKAIVTGRNVYANIKNAIAYLLSGNFSGILSVLYCTLLGLPLPFLPVHLLFINLITDSLPAIAIGMEPSNPSLLREKPRKQGSSILSKDVLKQIGIEGSLIAIATISAFYLGLQTSALTATTFAFSTLCLARLLHGFNCRGKQSIFTLRFTSNVYSIYAFLVGYVLLHAILLLPSLHSIFAVTDISIAQIALINGLALAPTIIIQIAKIIMDKKIV